MKIVSQNRSKFSDENIFRRFLRQFCTKNNINLSSSFLTNETLASRFQRCHRVFDYGTRGNVGIEFSLGGDRDSNSGIEFSTSWQRTIKIVIEFSMLSSSFQRDVCAFELNFHFLFVFFLFLLFFFALTITS
jgi:hypothetical protein